MDTCGTRMAVFVFRSQLMPRGYPGAGPARGAARARGPAKATWQPCGSDGTTLHGNQVATVSENRRNQAQIRLWHRLIKRTPRQHRPACEAARLDAEPRPRARPQPRAPEITTDPNTARARPSHRGVGCGRGGGGGLEKWLQGLEKGVLRAVATCCNRVQTGAGVRIMVQEVCR